MALSGAQYHYPPLNSLKLNPLMYFLNRIRPDLAADAEGYFPNARFWNASSLA